MSYKVKASLAALALAALSGSAMAAQIDNQNYGVGVTIQVLPIVSVWGFQDAVTLQLAGNDGNNSAYKETQFSYINNTPANISVKVNGALSNDVNFFISDASGPAVVAAMGGNAYNPSVPGSTVLRWHAGDINSSKVFDPAVATNLTGGVRPFTYLANSPGGTGGVAGTTYPLTVTWTIAANP